MAEQTLQIDKSKGAVYTKPIIVEMILDLVGYTSDYPLEKMRVLDPSFGDGAFLSVAVKRVIESYRARHGSLMGVGEGLKDCIRGIEVDPEAYLSCRRNLLSMLSSLGVDEEAALKLVTTWLVQDDFLLWSYGVFGGEQFDFVIGNPPYVRQELISPLKLKQYRKLYKTVYDRADLYVPFIQHGLELLKPNGKLGFICSDRFTRNKYGKVLRKFISENFAVKYIVDMHKTSPFENEVSAYPAIFVVANEEGRAETKAVVMESIDDSLCSEVIDFLLYDKQIVSTTKLKGIKFESWFEGEKPWIIESPEYLSVIKYLEEHFTPLENAGLKVGIGVATGADSVYLVDKKVADVEEDVLVPIVTTKDISSGVINWSGQYVINPFLQTGDLIDLEQYPKLSRYFLSNEEKIRARNVSKKNPQKWYRTIDRIYPELVFMPKLLIPDIKNENLIVYDEGKFYPHHNLYYILPGEWDIMVLKALLLSSITKFFIWTYATKMRGDFLRYQAQYLRKIRIPSFADISYEDIEMLRSDDVQKDQSTLDRIVANIYGLTDEQLQLIQNTLR